MEVEFIIRPDDVVAFHDYVWDHPPSHVRFGSRGPSWVIVFILGFTAALSIFVTIQGDRSFFSLLMPIIFALLLLQKLSWRTFMRRAVRRNLERRGDRNAKQLGWQRLTLTPDTIIEASQHVSRTVAWRMIDKIVIAGELALIFDSLTSAYIVPRRAFSNEDEFRDFVATARRYRDAAPNATSEGPSSDQKRVESDTNIMRDERADH